MTDNEYDSAVEKINTSLSHLGVPSQKVFVTELYSHLVFVKSYEPIISSVCIRARNLIGEKSLLLAPLDNDPIGSSSAALYDFRNVLSKLDIFKTRRFEGKNENAIAQLERDPDLILVLVDDYIGNGNQAKNTLNKIDAKLRGRVWVWTLVISRNGLELLFKESVNPLTGIVLDKFSELTKDPIGCRAAIREMSREQRLPRDFELGRFGSEAMLTLKNTPNNSYAFLWSKGQKNTWPAPFPRA